MEITLASLGITQEELQERVVERIAQQVMGEELSDEDGEPRWVRSNLAKRLDELVRARVNAEIERLAELHVLPKVTEMVANITLTQTNEWGEAKGAPVTFIEYLTQRADAYLREKVSYDGKAKGEDSYSWTGKTTRVAYLVEKHLQYNIESAMKAAVKGANESIVGGLQTAVNMKLKEIAGSITVSAKIP